MTTAAKPLSRPHALAIRNALTSAGMRVGDHKAPESTDGKIVTPCVVLYMAPSAPPTGSVGLADTDVLVRFRLMGIDLSPDGAQHQADKAFQALDGIDLDVENRGIFRLRRTALGSVERDDDVTPPCFYCSTPWSMLSVSAPEEGS